MAAQVRLGTSGSWRHGQYIVRCVQLEHTTYYTIWSCSTGKTILERWVHDSDCAKSGSFPAFSVRAAHEEYH